MRLERGIRIDDVALEIHEGDAIGDRRQQRSEARLLRFQLPHALPHEAGHRLERPAEPGDLVRIAFVELDVVTSGRDLLGGDLKASHAPRERLDHREPQQDRNGEGDAGEEDALAEGVLDLDHLAIDAHAEAHRRARRVPRGNRECRVESMIVERVPEHRVESRRRLGGAGGGNDVSLLVLRGDVIELCLFARAVQDLLDRPEIPCFERPSKCGGENAAQAREIRGEVALDTRGFELRAVPDEDCEDDGLYREDRRDDAASRGDSCCCLRRCHARGTVARARWLRKCDVDH
jgi:hypothetical protein